MSAFATHNEVEEILDNWAAEDPLGMFREGGADLISPYRLDACATVEPSAALLYAYDLLTPERRAWCLQQAIDADLRHYIPDRLLPERRRAIAIARGGGRAMTGPRLTPVEVIELRKIEGHGNLKAFAKVRLGNVMTINGLRVVRQEGQKPWCALPQQPARRKADGSGSGWFPILEDIYPALKQRISEVVLEAWESQRGEVIPPLRTERRDPGQHDEYRPIRSPRRAKPPPRPKPPAKVVRPPRRAIEGAPRMKGGSWDYNSPESEQ